MKYKSRNELNIEHNNNVFTAIKYLFIAFVVMVIMACANHIGFAEYQKAHPLWFTVIDNSGEMVERVQHKNNSTLETVVWVRVKYDSTGAIDDKEFNNPFAAKDYAIGSRLKWLDPSRDTYVSAKYDLPFYFNEWAGFLLAIGMFFVFIAGLFYLLSLKPVEEN